ncbi:MAG: peptide ABC transporter permease [Chloroflexi bacterium]|nr:MAG: peptide ABC transporter permease [Chloroflexota bacterium]
MHSAPGGPWSREKKLPEATVAALNAKYGLDDPIPIQYLKWVGGLLHGDLGPSYKYLDRSVNDIVADGIGTTVQLGIQAFLLSVIIGIPLGVIAALRHNGIPDYLATLVSVLGICTPSFVAAILLLVIFSVWLKWLPTFGWDSPANWILPTVALALFPIAQIARYTRASMLEVTRKDYVRTAHSKGLREGSIVVVHMIRNALIPVVTILGPILAFLITGSFIIEFVFSIPGIGRYYVTSIGQRDYGVIMAMTMIFAVAIAVMNLIVDVLYAYIDPRIRYS